MVIMPDDDARIGYPPFTTIEMVSWWVSSRSYVSWATPEDYISSMKSHGAVDEDEPD